MAQPSAEPAHHAPPVSRRWWVLVLLCLAQFMVILDVTVVNVALPSIGSDLHLGRQTLTWVVTAYTLVFGGLMLLGGRLADAVGARRSLLAGLALFTLASLTSGLASSGDVLIAGRIGQGAGAALLSPAALAIVTTTFHGADRTKALGVWAALGGIGSAAGVLLGGVLTAATGWEWVFFINLPAGIALLVALPLTVPAIAPRPTRLDLPGALLVTTATSALIYGLVKAGDAGWTGPATLTGLAAAAVLYAAFYTVERVTPAPLVDLKLLTRRPIVAGAVLMLVATALLIAFFFLGSVYLQHTRGYTALATGIMFLPVAVATGIGAHLGSRLVGHTGGRPVAAAGLGLAAVGAWLLTGLSIDGNPWTQLLPGFVLAATGIGATFVTATTTALGFITGEQAGLTSGLVNTFHEVGGSIGVAVVSTLAAAGIEAATLDGYDIAFTISAIAAALTAVAALGLIPAGRPHLTGAPHGH